MCRCRCIKSIYINKSVNINKSHGTIRGFHNTLITRMGLRRLELPTSRLSGVRSNRLSYKPLCFSQNVYYNIFCRKSRVFYSFSPSVLFFGYSFECALMTSLIQSTHCFFPSSENGKVLSVFLLSSVRSKIYGPGHIHA